MPQIKKFNALKCENIMKNNAGCCKELDELV